MPSADHRALAIGYAIALEEGRRALDEQERAVAQLSTRAGLLISAAAVVTSLLSGPVLARDALDLASWIAIAAFVGVAPAGAPPMSWGTWILYMFGFPVRRPQAEDEWRRRNS